MVQNNCKQCGKETPNPLFCCRSCSAKYNNSRREPRNSKSREKVSQSLKAYYKEHDSEMKGKKWEEIMTPKRKEYLERVKEEKLSRPVRMYNGDTINITYQELAEYKKSHQVCDLCGGKADAYRADVKNLCVDHDHKTKKFRGLLCQKCNYYLGWYEARKDEIEKYLGGVEN